MINKKKSDVIAKNVVMGLLMLMAYVMGGDVVRMTGSTHLLWGVVLITGVLLFIHLILWILERLPWSREIIKETENDQ